MEKSFATNFVASTTGKPRVETGIIGPREVNYSKKLLSTDQAVASLTDASTSSQHHSSSSRTVFSSKGQLVRGSTGTF